MADLISIVLPVYNGEKYLRESIDSVLAQTYTDWELLLMDDRSTDQTSSICREYAEKDNRIKYFCNEKNLRLPGNLNRGFFLSKGNYLTWTSDDNRYRENALEVMLSALKENHVDLVYASYQVMDENGLPGEVIHADPRALDHIPGSNVVGACFLYTREAFERVGKYDTDLMLVEDFDFWQRMIACCSVYVIEQVLYDYRWHSGSLTSTKKQKEFGRVLEQMLLKNKSVFQPMNMEQKWFYYKCLRRSYTDQGKQLKGSLRSALYSVIARSINKLKRSEG